MTLEPATGLTQIEAAYENVIAICQNCGERCVFNRSTEFDDSDGIAHRQVVCHNEACRKQFIIGGDLINPPYEMLLLDGEAFLQEKRYMQATLSAATAYEVFFDHFMRVELVFRPANREDGIRDTLDWLNRAEDNLHKKLARLTFEPMRRLFLRAAVDGIEPATTAEADAYIASIPARVRDIQEIRRSEIEGMPDAPLRGLLLRVFDATIGTLRNSIIHKSAYRPTRSEATDAVMDAYDTVFCLSAHYDFGTVDHHLNEGPVYRTAPNA